MLITGCLFSGTHLVSATEPTGNITAPFVVSEDDTWNSPAFEITGGPIDIQPGVSLTIQGFPEIHNRATNNRYYKHWNNLGFLIRENAHLKITNDADPYYPINQYKDRLFSVLSGGSLELSNTEIYMYRGSTNAPMIWVAPDASMTVHNTKFIGDPSEDYYNYDLGVILRVGGTADNDNAPGGKITFTGDNVLKNIQGKIRLNGTVEIKDGTTTIDNGDITLVNGSGTLVISDGGTLKLSGSLKAAENIRSEPVIYVKNGGKLVTDSGVLWPMSDQDRPFIVFEPGSSLEMLGWYDRFEASASEILVYTALDPVTIVKSWEDDGNERSHRPSKDDFLSYLTINARGEDYFPGDPGTNQTVEVTENGDQYTVTFKFPPKIDLSNVGGIFYSDDYTEVSPAANISVSESGIPYYTGSEVTDAGNNTFSLTNTIIPPVKLTLDWDKDTFVYNGSEQVPVILSVNDEDGHDLTEELLPSITVTNDPSVNVGDYRITAALDESLDMYTLDAETAVWDYAITKADLVKDTDFTAPAGLTDLVYNGGPQELLPPGAWLDGEKGSFQYKLSRYTRDAEDGFSAEIPTGTDAGFYTLEWKILGDANHNDYIPDETLESEIGKASIVIRITGNTDTQIYDGRKHTVIGFTSESDSPLFDDQMIGMEGSGEVSGTDVGTYYIGL